MGISEGNLGFLLGRLGHYGLIRGRRPPKGRSGSPGCMASPTMSKGSGLGRFFLTHSPSRRADDPHQTAYNVLWSPFYPSVS